MSELPPGVTQADLDKYAKIEAAIAKLKPERDRLNDLIKTSFPVGTFVHGNVVIERSVSNLKDPKGVEKAFPYQDWPEYYVDEPKLVFNNLPSDVQAEFTNQSQRLSVKVVD